MPSDPVLSDHVYRYLWDGKIFYHGFNPNIHLPDSPVLEGLRDNVVYPNINYSGVPIDNSPITQLLFTFSYIIGYSVFTWKILLFLFEGILVYFLVKLINYFKLNPLRLSIYFINPLVIIETYSSAHFEVVALCFFIAGIFSFYKNKNTISIFMFILSILSKYNLLLMGIPFLKKNFMKKVSIVVGVILLAIIPYASVPISKTISFGYHPDFIGFFHMIFLLVINFWGGNPQDWFTFGFNEYTEGFYLSGSFYFKMIAVFILIFIIIDQLKKLKMTENFKGINYLKPALFIGSSILLLSSTLYPWHLIWIIPLLIFLPNWSWLFFTMLIQLSYYTLQHDAIKGSWEESTLVLILQYIPFYGLLIYEYLDKKKIKGWFL